MVIDPSHPKPVNSHPNTQRNWSHENMRGAYAVMTIKIGLITLLEKRLDICDVSREMVMIARF
ncbi:hypothetical protein K469DRAFT_769737 [Zopfia rhizophila CBS 207.26]|uniref:Uncharacterized protein n=1 Tax=Zopfia rhizophila CBS 207.26 TaxID=1314779 RepID=A0A6A6E7Y5_9PEZI|nr:hypothetical protein K469DRAFT_769737 [Zopfia rhizophila CBS 207.26]